MTSSDGRPSAPPRLRVWLWGAMATCASVIVTIVLTVAVVSAVPFSSETLRQKVIETLSDRLESDVDLAGLHIRLLPRFHAEGFGLTIRHKRHHNRPPLITVKKLSVDADLLGLVRKHVAQVTLEGLDIEIPPHDADHGDEGTDRGKPADRHGLGRDARSIVVDNLVSTDARLAIIPAERGKAPKVWAIHELHMRSVSFDRSMPFEATLTNAVPPGEIDTRGSFGPWEAEDPGNTPLAGTFTFANANLNVFTGISGMLSARGAFGGSLGRIDIHGETDTPHFTVAVAGHPVPLHARYHAIVDGTNGDTELERIDASFLETSLIAAGSVIDTPGKDGRTVRLTVTMESARLEDVLRLVLNATKPPMTGALKVTTSFVLPPGQRDVLDKLRLDGQFALNAARFTSLDIQKKVDELSHRSRGKPPDEKQQGVISGVTGRFRLGDGRLELPGVTFGVPGAAVRLAGHYDLRPETLDFRGTLFMDAKISQTTTGFKRILLKIVDPLFKSDGGGSAIPIKITGTRSEPSFGLDTGRVFNRDRSSYP